MRGSEKNSYFTRQFLVNLLVCMMVVALVTPLCISFYVAFDEHQRENYRNALQVMFNDVNTNLDIMRNLVRNTEINESLQRLRAVTGKPQFKDTLSLMKARDYVAILTQSNPYIEDCMVMFARNDIILTKKSVYYTREEFEKFYQFESAVLDQLIEEVHNSQARTGCRPAAEYTYIDNPNTPLRLASKKKPAFCYGISFDSLQASGEFFLFISEDALLEKLPVHFRTFSQITLQTGIGETIYCYRGENFKENMRFIEVSLGQPGSNLCLTAHLNTAAISSMIASTRRLLMVYIAGALLAVVGLAVFFTQRQFKPMRTVLEQLRDFGYTLPRDKEQFTFVVQAIRDMQFKHRDVTQTLATYRDQLRNTQLERLLSSPYTSEMQMPDSLPEKYRIGYAYILPDEEQVDSTLLGTLVVRQLRHCVPQNVWVHQVENDVFALIVPIEVTIDELHGMLARINAEIPQTLCLAMSAEAQGPEEMHAAFENARMNSMGQSAVDVLRVPKESVIHQGINIQSGMRVYHEIIAGNTKRACECISEMMRNPASPFCSVAECYEYIRLNICFAIQDANLSNEYAPPASPGAVPPEKLLHLLLQSAEQLGQMEKMRTVHKKTQMETEILEWVDENISDWTLNAEAVARRFAISERKVQSIVRQTGEASFSGYLQQRRMMTVTKLLTETTLPVSDISFRAGYNTSSTFFKAFKRIYGVSPSEYRALQKDAENTM